MKSLIALFFVIAQLISQAHAEVNDFAQKVVKVYSGTCRKAPQLYKGSGVLVQVQDKTYVLTSNHVIQNMLPADCHEVENGDLGRIRATVVASDWGMGLALLEIARSVDSAIKLEAFEDSPQATDKVVTAGFPFELKTPAISPDGQILSTQSYRHFFPNTDALIEIINAHGEYGMSGGAVFLQDSKKFLGVLSHQALVTTEAGKEPEVQTLNAPENHLLVISAKTAKNWIMQVMSSKQGATPSFEAPALDRVVTGGMVFTLLSADNPVSTKIGGGGDPVGIGGRGDPVGIGGRGDPVGIGGDPVGIGGSDSDDDRQYGVIQVSKLKNSTSLAVSSTLLSRAWWSDLSKMLLQTDNVYIQVMIRKEQTDAGVASYKLLHIVSLEQFFHRLLENEGVLPLLIDLSKKEMSASEKRVHEETDVVLAMLAKFAAVPGVSAPSKRHLANIQFVASILKSSQWKAVSSAEIQQLVEGDSVEADWNELFTLSFQTTVDLMSSLRKMMELL